MSKGQVYFILAVLFALLVAVLAIQNPEPVGITLLFWQLYSVPKFLLILISTAVGALVVVLLGLFWNIGKFIHIRRLEGEIKDLKGKLTECSSVVAPKESVDSPTDPSGTTGPAGTPRTPGPSE